MDGCRVGGGVYLTISEDGSVGNEEGETVQGQGEGGLD